MCIRDSSFVSQLLPHRGRARGPQLLHADLASRHCRADGCAAGRGGPRERTRLHACLRQPHLRQGPPQGRER
eukprot:14556010-Alexandrium_andersonii.AAC.1